LDIQNEINQQEKDLENVRKELENALSNLEATQQELASQQSELETLNIEISLVNQEIEVNQMELDLLNEEIQLKKLEKEEQDRMGNEMIKSGYMRWRSKDLQLSRLLANDDLLEKRAAYEAFLAKVHQRAVTALLDNLLELNLLFGQYDVKVSELKLKDEELRKKKSELEARLWELKNAVNSVSNDIGALKNQQENIENQIQNLLEEQKQAFELEKKILEQDPGGGGGDIKEGEWFFYGSGRDLYQGHGVGMSQWGAHGMASNGFSYSDILTFYYDNTDIADNYFKDINVDGYGIMSLESYVAGLGEVPSKACGTEEQVQQNSMKYKLDDPNTLWDCWPEEAIKAQVVAARTYAWWYTSVFGSICTSASCQVYTGGSEKLWAAQETEGKVIVYNGSPIEAVYSSDNNQGYGTADNDTIWQNIFGDGTPYAYLRSKNDNDYATPTQWTNWTYQTSGFTSQDINNMLTYVVDQSGYSSATKNAIQDIINDIGEVQSLSFVRDNSLRVKKVILKGENGNERSIGGWWFKNIWNNWSYGVGRGDYIYSQTFFLSSK
jgi:predicted  nucleic acid-binding Zn-ribbon protein